VALEQIVGIKDLTAHQRYACGHYADDVLDVVDYLSELVTSNSSRRGTDSSQQYDSQASRDAASLWICDAMFCGPRCLRQTDATPQALSANGFARASLRHRRPQGPSGAMRLSRH
jgi:hypothetical protein